LAALGCDVAQGYYFSRALEPAELANWAADAAGQADIAA
jgi:EAL domain-containing protein (putative c-di-GMP-specific phosphodiesterase class I)